MLYHHIGWVLISAGQFYSYSKYNIATKGRKKLDKMSKSCELHRRDGGKRTLQTIAPGHQKVNKNKSKCRITQKNTEKKQKDVEGRIQKGNIF